MKRMIGIDNLKKRKGRRRTPVATVSSDATCGKRISFAIKVVRESIGKIILVTNTEERNTFLSNSYSHK